MRFAEKLMLGSTLIPWERLTPGEPGGPGCAMGMVQEAAGSKAVMQDGQRRLPSGDWLWCQKALSPCVCLHSEDIRQHIGFIVTHLFDEHVHPARRHDWTIERLADWVDQFEPREHPQEQSQPQTETVCEVCK